MVEPLTTSLYIINLISILPEKGDEVVAKRDKVEV